MDPEVPEKALQQPGECWRFSVLYLCFYGFMAQIKPAESFITPYLLGPDKNFTREQLTNEITPVLSYAYMSVLVPVFLLTDYLRYKPVLILQSLSHVAIWLLLLFGTTVLQMQFMEFFYGITMAARVAYSSYIFTLVSPQSYQKVASYSRSSVLMGVFVSSVLGQLFVTLGDVPFLTLNYISLGFVTFAFTLTLFLKRPKRTMFFNRRQAVAANGVLRSEAEAVNATSISLVAEKQSPPRGWQWRDLALIKMILELKDTVRSPQLKLWSLWWIFNSTGYYLVVYYVQILWDNIHPSRENRGVYNGGVDAAATLLGAIASFSAGHVKLRWSLWAELVIFVITALQAGLLFLMNTTTNIWVCYVGFVLFRSSHQLLVPIAIFQIAMSLSKELCALVFGINTFLATILKTIITLIIADKRGLGLHVNNQFYFYIGHFSLLASIYLGRGLYVLARHQREQKARSPQKEDETNNGLVTEMNGTGGCAHPTCSKA
ncbi:reduced folate transporter isoform X1 [Rhincodon typus]|uniref:reduced folate transporter isoform X1 n=2 Tax=Rhincodon typus TaxID=259920 RepID=UPI0009A2EC0D|nr:reduced folate transporter isoform X1 [Rhincodon typus]XP_048455352.1 reduced folate transporter isoform X1 [Rhincodon typus]